MVPLFYAANGRSETNVTDVSIVDGSETYMVTTESHPFFDFSQGLRYNIQSVSMLVSPLSTTLSIYLCLTAQSEIQRGADETARRSITSLDTVPTNVNRSTLA